MGKYKVATTQTVARQWGLSTIEPLKRDDKGFPYLLGLEVELEGFSPEASLPNYMRANWTLKGDSSLRNNGMELVTSGGKRGSQLVIALRDLGEYFKEESLVVSHRCSLHTHIDMREATLEEVERFFLLYMLLEPVLYDAGGKERYWSIYCPGLTHTTESIKRAAIAFNSNDFRQITSTWNKYTGINFCRLPDLGTVEIRTHRGTTDIQEITNWCSILTHIKEASKRFSLQDIEAMSSNASMVLSSVFPPVIINSLNTELYYNLYNNIIYNYKYYNYIIYIINSNLFNQQVNYQQIEEAARAYVRTSRSS